MFTLDSDMDVILGGQSACRALESAIAQGYKTVEVRTDSSYTIMGKDQFN